MGIKDAVQAVVQDLTQTLTKDIKKRMCETLGFYLFERWWQEQETKYKEKHSNVPSTTKSTWGNNKKLPTPALVSETTTIPKEIIASKSSIPRIPRVEDISSFFDKQRESMETTGSFRSGFGLGFRGTIPKLPAFKKKPGSESSKKESRKKDYSSDEKDGKKKSEKS